MNETKPTAEGDYRGREAARQARRQSIETLIDEIGAQSFPASDPPTWGTVATRLEQATRDADMK
jgi:hypothetical protein